MSAQIKYQEDNLILTIPKSMMDDRQLRRIVELVEFLNLSEKNKMSTDEAWALSEEVKESWWAENGESSLLN